MPKRSEYKERLSRRGRNGARIRWSRYHENLPPCTYPPDLPADCIRITVENLITQKTHVLVFHPGSRRGRFLVDVDGVFWRECGWSEALAGIRKSCKRTPLYVYDSL